jgi:hypothetical protein
MLRSRRAKHAHPVQTIPKSVLFESYAEPSRKDMAIIMVFYNPANSLRLVQNLLTVKQKLEVGRIPHFVAELAYDSHPFVLAPADNVFQYRSDSYLFYKENLINLAERRIPPEFTKICILDADIIFNTPSWYDVISNELETYDICQCFSNAYMTDITFTHCLQTLVPAKLGGHEGYAWSVRRSQIFNHGGFPDFAVIGGGDSVFIGRKIPNSYKKDADDYHAKLPQNLTQTFAPNIGIFHLFHGPIGNRQYCNRHTPIVKLLETNRLQMITDILFRRNDGLFMIRPEYIATVNSIMKTYFANRNDDAA